MNATHDRLDEAIDQVAKRLTRVEDNAALATQIISALPEHSRWFGWKPRFALATVALAATIGVVLRPFDDRSSGVLRTGSGGAPFVQFRAAVERTTVEPELIVRRTSVERPSNDRRTSADHERSLVALAPPAALSLKAVAPSELPGQGALAVEPLAIADLPLTAETISPR